MYKTWISSVMIDGSRFEFEGNVAITKKVIEVAHAVGVSVEAELGKIGGTEDHITVSERDATFTDPEEAKRFVDETNVDFLAIAVGTAHGVYRGGTKARLRQDQGYKEITNIPLVLHGSSGVPDEAIKKSCIPWDK